MSEQELSYADPTTVVYTILSNDATLSGMVTSGQLTIEKKIQSIDPLSSLEPSNPEQMIVVDTPQNKESEIYSQAQLGTFVDQVRITLYVRFYTQSANASQADIVVEALRQAVLNAIKNGTIPSGIVNVYPFGMPKPMIQENYTGLEIAVKVPYFASL
jgi:hypothetical protein